MGAGTRLLAAVVSRCGASVTVVDPDPGMLHIAAVGAPSVLFHEAGLPHLPLPDDTFDVVLAAFVINHLQDPRVGVRELTRVAAPGWSRRRLDPAVRSHPAVAAVG